MTTAETRKGGRGQCDLCGEYHNNVSYHRAWECSKRKCWDCGKRIDKCKCGVAYCPECSEEIGMCVCQRQPKCDRHPDYDGKEKPNSSTCTTCWDIWQINHYPIKAPQWLVDRMQNLKKLPPPTLEEVRQQFEASANWIDDCVNEIKNADRIR